MQSVLGRCSPHENAEGLTACIRPVNTQGLRGCSRPGKSLVLRLKEYTRVPPRIIQNLLLRSLEGVPGSIYTMNRYPHP